MGRKPCCSKEGMNRGAWTASEDKILTEYIKLHGEGKWRDIPREAGLKRCGKSCRLRWMNYLRPGIKRGNISSDEEDLIIRLHKLLGNRWSLIAGRLPGRTDNEIKNYWNTHLSKRGQDKEPRPKHSHCSYVVDDVSSKSCVIRTKASRCKEVFLSGGEITTSVSEIFASDFSKLSRDLGGSDMDNVMLGDRECDVYTSFTIGEPQAFGVPDEMMEHNWSCGSDVYNINVQASLDSDFGSLVDFLESADEWII